MNQEERFHKDTADALAWCDRHTRKRNDFSNLIVAVAIIFGMALLMLYTLTMVG